MSKRVLVINNNVPHANGYKYLIKAGYKLDVVHDSYTGLQKLAAQDYDAIIVRESLESESWLLCEEIRRVSGIPLIVISKNASTETCVRAINAGADYFLRKPCGSLELLARVQSLLYRASAKQSVPIGS
jgi:DNA-binding response OmpR family regulator